MTSPRSPPYHVALTDHRRGAGTAATIYKGGHVQLALALVTGLLAADSEGVKFFEGTWEKTLEEAGKTKRLVFADFSTEW